MSNIREKAYEEGKKAFQHNCLWARNPYAKGSEEAKEWDRGCDEAFDTLLREEGAKTV